MYVCNIFQKNGSAGKSEIGQGEEYRATGNAHFYCSGERGKDTR